MNWKFFVIGVIACLVVILTIWQSKAKRKLRERAQQQVESILKNLPEDVKFLISVSENVFARSERLGFEGLTDSEKVFFCIWTLEAEVNNGGFDQFFFNSWGKHSVEAVDAFEKIGATKTAGIVQRANSLFKNGRPPKDRTARQKELDALSQSAKDSLSRLDNEFYEYDENLEKLLHEFVVKHHAEFLKP